MRIGRKEKEESLENEEDNIFWVKIDGEKRLATINLVPGNQVYKEKLVKIKDEEFRAWDPFRSKLGAAIMNGLQSLPIVRKSRVLYLGVSTGTTASHVSDIVGPNGIVFCVEHSSAWPSYADATSSPAAFYCTGVQAAVTAAAVATQRLQMHLKCLVKTGGKQHCPLNSVLVSVN